MYPYVSGQHILMLHVSIILYNFVSMAWGTFLLEVIRVIQTQNCTGILLIATISTLHFYKQQQVQYWRKIIALTKTIMSIPFSVPNVQCALHIYTYMKKYDSNRDHND